MKKENFAVNKRQRILSEMLYGIEIDEYKYSICLKLLKTNRLNECIINKDTLKIDFNNMPQFDYIVGNPPYLRGMHTKIFNLSFDALKEGGKIIFIHPGTLLLNRKPIKFDREEQKFLDIINEYKTDIKFVNGNALFDIAQFVPLSITEVEKVKSNIIEVVYSHLDPLNTKVHQYQNLDSVTIHGNDLAKIIKDKVFAKMTDTIFNHLERRGGKGKFKLRIPTVCGNVNSISGISKDFYQLIYKQDENDLAKLLNHTFLEKYEYNVICVNTLIESQNCFDYLKTKFARFCLSFYKINVQLSRGELKAVPFMDFTQCWDDQKLFKYFNLTEEEQNYIKEFIPNLYETDK